MADPISGNSSAQAVGEVRINDLEAVTDENISLSMNFAVDFPNETFKATFLQIVDYMEQYVIPPLVESGINDALANEVPDQIETAINNQYAVGDIIIGTSQDTPQTRGLSGTWEVIESQTAINSVELTNGNLGSITGQNDVSSPLLEHNHTATIESVNLGTKTSGGSGSHNHNSGLNSGTTNTVRYGYSTNSTGNYSSQNAGSNTTLATSVNVSTASNHTHSVVLGSHTHTATIDNEGTSGAQINVQGKILNVIVWQKTAL